MKRAWPTSPLRRQFRDLTLRLAVDRYFQNPSATEALYGPIAQWDVSKVTNMRRLFCGEHDFNGDLSKWDVSSVTDMRWMFHRARAFNCDLSMWDTSHVVDMGRMFKNAHAFNGDLNAWDTSSVSSPIA